MYGLNGAHHLESRRADVLQRGDASRWWDGGYLALAQTVRVVCGLYPGTLQRLSLFECHVSCVAEQRHVVRHGFSYGADNGEQLVERQALGCHERDEVHAGLVECLRVFDDGLRGEDRIAVLLRAHARGEGTELAVAGAWQAVHAYLRVDLPVPSRRAESDFASGPADMGCFS